MLSIHFSLNLLRVILLCVIFLILNLSIHCAKMADIIQTAKFFGKFKTIVHNYSSTISIHNFFNSFASDKRTFSPLYIFILSLASFFRTLSSFQINFAPVNWCTPLHKFTWKCFLFSTIVSFVASTRKLLISTIFFYAHQYHISCVGASCN